jgi:predicted ArsR family transcriptional regulator
MALGIANSSPAGQILEHLQRNGPATIKALEEALGVSTTAVREQLVHLQAEGLVAASAVRRGAGRPHNLYSLTDKARRLFPKSYDVLIDLLLREIAAQEGGARLEHLLARISERLAEQYAVHVTGDELRQRLEALRGALEQQGIPAAVSPVGDGLSVFACPYFEVAQDHPGLCSMERQMFERVLGEKIVLEQAIREGYNSCRFMVKSEG